MDHFPTQGKGQQPDLSLDSLNESTADLTRICWTQLLLAAELDDKPPLVLPVAPADSFDDDPFS